MIYMYTYRHAYAHTIPTNISDNDMHIMLIYIRIHFIV